MTGGGDDQHRQRRLTRDEIAAICRRAFGAGGRIVDVRALAGGTVNTTYRLDVAGEGPFVLRIAPAPDIAAAGPSWLTTTTLREEHALTPWLAPIAPLLPRTRAADFTRQLVDRDWIIQTIVPGEPWSELDDRLAPDERADLWRQLGAIARAIHSVEGPAFGPPGRPAARWSDVVRADIDGLRRDWQRFGLPQPELIARLVAVVDRGQERLDAVGPPRLVHGDLYPRHVFVARDTDGYMRIAGLIDHEYGRFADPASGSLFELIGHQAHDLPPEAAAFFDTYGPLPDDAPARWRSLVYKAVMLGWAAGDAAHLRRANLLRETLAGFKTAVEQLNRAYE